MLTQCIELLKKDEYKKEMAQLIVPIVDIFIQKFSPYFTKLCILLGVNVFCNIMITYYLLHYKKI